MSDDKKVRYVFDSYRDVYAKLKRDVALFNKEPNDDHLFNAMVTAWSLADWLVADLTEPGREVTDALQTDLLNLTGKTSANQKPSRCWDKMPDALRQCADIADGGKHGRLDRSTRIVSEVQATAGTYGSGVYGFSRYGDLNCRYAIFTGEAVQDAKDVLSAVLALYDSFLTEYGLLEHGPPDE